MKYLEVLALIILGYSPLVAKEKNKLPVDLILYNGTIYTVDSDWNIYHALAVKNGKIVDLGTDKKILSEYETDNRIDLKKNFAYPGFIDAHCHFSGYGLDKYKCELMGSNSFDEVISRVIAYEKSSPLDWIYGRGWDQNLWPVKEFPTKDTLDELFPDKIVVLQRVDGHALICNQKALDAAKINRKTKIAGGIIVKDKDGDPTGVLIDNAMDPVEKLIPMLPREQAIKHLIEAEQDCYSLGLTGVVDCGVGKKTIVLLKDLYDSSELSIGYTLLLSDDTETLNAYAKYGPQNFGQLQIAGIKQYADGALGSRGACLKEDYTDRPGERGVFISTIGHYDSIANIALQYNLQLCTHAIGDSANAVMLKLYGKYLEHPNDKRWRIEHAQIVDPEDQHYFRDYSIVPSVQTTHATSDGPWAETRLGKRRMKGAYAYNDLLKQTGYIALGTDFPVEAINPIATFYTGVFRINKPKAKPFQLDNGLSRKDALRGMTIWAAKSVFRDKEKGSLEPGKDADIVVLDTDLMKESFEKIYKTKVLYTIVTGKIKYKH